MATILNVFKTVTAVLTVAEQELYVAPPGYTSIVLMAQVSNVTTSSKTVTVSHFFSATTTELLKDFAIPANDAVSATTGKLVLESGHSVKASTSVDNSCKVTLSILETLNG
jgi:hypothetical protein